MDKSSFYDLFFLAPIYSWLISQEHPDHTGVGVTRAGAAGISSLGDGVCSRGETDTILASNKAALFNIHDGCEKQARWIHQTPEERLGRFIPNRGRDGHMQYIPR